MKSLYTALLFWMVWSNAPAYCQQFNTPNVLRQFRLSGSEIANGARIEADRARFQVSIQNPYRCSTVALEVELLSAKAKPQFFVSPSQQACWSGPLGDCPEPPTISLTAPLLPDTVYNWRARVHMEYFRRNIDLNARTVKCDPKTGDGYSDWKSFTSVGAAFTSLPRWEEDIRFGAHLTETDTHCGIQREDHSSDAMAYPPDEKYAAFKTTTKPGCLNKIKLGLGFVLPSKEGVKDEVFVGSFKSNRECRGRIYTLEDTEAENEVVLRTFTLKPDAKYQFISKLRHSEKDISQRDDFITFVRRYGDGGFVPMYFECQAASDFDVSIDTFSLLYRSQLVFGLFERVDASSLQAFSTTEGQ